MENVGKARAERALQFIGEMRAPCPPECLQEYLDRALVFYSEEKVMEAGKILEQLEDGLEMSPDVPDAQRILSELGETGGLYLRVSKLKQDFARCRKTLMNFVSEDEWLLSQVGQSICNF